MIAILLHCKDFCSYSGLGWINFMLLLMNHWQGAGPAPLLSEFGVAESRYEISKLNL